MHREDNSSYLLYIEPKKEQKLSEPINDVYIELMLNALNRSTSGVSRYNNKNDIDSFIPDVAYRGIHRTDCGKVSSNQDYKLENGMITNSLCWFYFQYYRNSIPQSEWIKINKLKEFYNF